MIITTVTTDNGAILPIGRQGEKGVRQVWFDLAYLITNFGEGTAVLVHQRSKDAAPYIISTQQTGNNLMWTIDETDTAFEGIGKAEIRWTVDDTLAKTVIYKTNVQKSLASETEVPDPYESWYDALLTKIGDSQEYAEQADQSAQDASQSAQDAETAAGTAAQDAASAVRAEMTGYVNSAQQSANTAQQAATKAASDTSEAIRAEMSGYANRAETAANDAARSAQALSGMTVTVGATDKGSGIVEISATVNRG